MTTEQPPNQDAAAESPAEAVDRLARELEDVRRREVGKAVEYDRAGIVFAAGVSATQIADHRATSPIANAIARYLLLIASSPHSVLVEGPNGKTFAKRTQGSHPALAFYSVRR